MRCAYGQCQERRHGRARARMCGQVNLGNSGAKALVHGPCTSRGPVAFTLTISSSFCSAVSISLAGFVLSLSSPLLVVSLSCGLWTARCRLGRCVTASCLFALLSFARTSGGKGFGSSWCLLLENAMGPRCACWGRAVVVWYYDADVAVDANLTEGDMHLARTPISTPPSAQISRRSRRAPGRRGGWEGISNSLIVI